MFFPSTPAKHYIRSCIDLIALGTGLLAFCENRMRRGHTILMYHRILPEKQCSSYPLESLVIPQNVFSKQMEWLSLHFTVKPVRDALKALHNGYITSKPLVSVTFDDGYADNFELAAPILEKWDLRGTFFITSGFVENGKPLWFDRASDLWKRLSDSEKRLLINKLPINVTSNINRNSKAFSTSTWMESLKKADPDLRMDIINRGESLSSGEIVHSLYRPMTIDQIADLNRRGHEIGSHTVSHHILPQLDDTKLLYEIKKSADQIKSWTGNNISGFCYPNGDFDDRTEKAIFESGYKYACTTASGLNYLTTNNTRLKRLSITMQRTVRNGTNHNSLGFRSELCRFRELCR